MNAFEIFQDPSIIIDDAQLVKIKAGGDPPDWPYDDDDA